MRKATTLIMFSIFLVLMSMATVCAEENATFDEVLEVDDALDEEVVSEGEIKTFDDLAALINGSDDVIELKDDYKYSPTDNVATGGITINRPVTINGNGRTIDASHSVRIFIVNSSNVVLNNINFINGNSTGNAGAIGANAFDNFTINNCNFSNNSANYGGAVLSNAMHTKITDCNFNDNHADTSGGAVYLAGNESVIENSIFTSNDAWTTNMGYGGAVYFTGSDGLIKNSIFDSNEAHASGGALYVSGSGFKLNNTSFKNNSATYGGSIFSKASYTTFDNTTFEENVASDYGGAIYVFRSYYPIIKNSKFTSNKVTEGYGGAIYSDGYYDIYENVTFEKNEAYYVGGSLALLGVPNAKVNDCYFDSSSANYLGGGIYTNSWGCEINNSTFVNSYAATGAGVYMIYSDLDTNSSSNAYIRDSKFFNNTALYGGAGVSATSHATISNSEFRDNRAGNYGGAVDLTHASLINSTLENNSAIFGGAVYIHASDIINSTFRDNSAQAGNAIYILNSSNLEGNDVSDEDVFTDDVGSSGKVYNKEGDTSELMETDEGYFGYCSERYNLSPHAGVYDNSLEKLKNSINHQPIGDYLKILIYYYVDVFEDLDNYDFSNHVWDFTDREYWNSEDPVVREVIRLYDSGLRVSTENGCKVLANGTLMYFNFSSLVTPSGEQNMFLFKFSHEDVLNQTLTKEALINKTVYLGDTVEYRIVINNKGASPVYGNWIEDKDYSAGLIYKTWRAEVGNWTYSEQTGRWTLDVLDPGKSASIIVTFGVTLDGLLYNNATSGLGVVNVSESGAGFKAYNRNMTVEKKTLTPQVNVGDEAMFEIVVTNTGDVDLENVFVCESEYGSGLVYLDYISRVGTWKHSLNEDGKHVFTLTEVLERDDSASLRIIFKATQAGNFSNTVTAGDNGTELSNSTNTTEVLGNDTSDVSENKTADKKTAHSKTNKTSVVRKISESNVSDEKHEEVFKAQIDEKATGNPLMILILALILIPLRRFRK